VGRDTLQINRDYYVLRYLPGASLGLRSFAQDVPGWSATDVNGNVRTVGWKKIITNRGIMLVMAYLYGSQNAVTQNHFVYKMPFSGVPPNPDKPNRIPNWPYLLIEEQFYVGRPSAVALPPGFKRLVFSNMEPTAITIGDYEYSTASNEPVIKKWFQERARDIPITDCLQFRLIDRISARAIATVRYLQELDTFVVNSFDNISHRALRTSPENIDITTPLQVARTLDFTTTNTNEWSPRTSDVFLATLPLTQEQQDVVIENRVFAAKKITAKANAYMKKNLNDLRMWDFKNGVNTDRILLHKNVQPVFKEGEKKDIHVSIEPSKESAMQYFLPRGQNAHSNAALALSVLGGGMSGVGQAFGQYAQNKFQEKMQGNQFQHETNLQGNQFQHETNLQGNMFQHQTMLQDKNFDFQKYMQQGNFAQEQLMQERQYQNDLGLLQSSHQEQRQTNREQSQNRITERGLSARSMNLPGLTSGVSTA